MNHFCCFVGLPTIDATTILALATVLLAAATVWLALESRQASLRQIGVQTWLGLMLRFDSEEMKRERSVLAKQLKAYDPTKHDEIREAVLDFFEDVGTVYKEGFINKKLADSTFGFYVCRWYVAAKPYIEQERKRHGEDRTLFEDFTNIANLMRLPREKIDDREAQRFLDDEIRLSAD